MNELEIIQSISENKQNYLDNKDAWTSEELTAHNAIMKGLYSALQALYLDGAYVPSNASAMFGMKRRENLYQIGADVLVNDGVKKFKIHISSQGSTIEECVKNWNERF
jgi:hypothetical protein